ncbi:MAG: radical SAM protein [Elusimicrobiota bacterium]
MSIAVEVKKFLKELGNYMEENVIGVSVGANPPSELHFELTYRCDSDCIMCDLKYRKKRQKNKDLSLAKIKKIVENSEMLDDIRYIILSGGEPWLHSEFPAIVSFFRKRYPRPGILILSNLLNTDKVLSGIKEIEKTSGLDNISLGTSLDGIKGVHDRIRGVNGAFDALVESALLLRKKYPGMFPCFNFTLIPENSDQIFPVYEWAGKMGFRVSFQLMVQKKDTQRFEWTPENITAVEHSIDCIIEDIYNRMDWAVFSPAQLFNDLSLLFYLLDFHYLLKYLKDPARFFPDCPCGERFAMMDPEGNLYFCPVHKEMLAGNVRVSGFDAVWSGDKAEKIREYFNSKKCHCWLSCTNGVMLEKAFFPNKERILKRFN